MGALSLCLFVLGFDRLSVLLCGCVFTDWQGLGPFRLVWLGVAGLEQRCCVVWAALAWIELGLV